MNRISEEEFESERERRSSPPGTIGGDVQDVMSENIESSLKLLRRKHKTGTAGVNVGGVATYNNGIGPQSSGTANFERMKQTHIFNCLPKTQFSFI